MGITEKVCCFLEKIPLKQSDTILVAVSGGGDSMALLTLLWKIAQMSEEKRGKIPSYSLAVAHFNHQSRGEENEKEATLVAEYVKNLQENRACFPKNGHTITKQPIPFFLGTAPVNHLAKAEKRGFEEMARDLRYGFFQETAAKIGATFVATAHHAEDNLETFLLHLCRGAGLQGLSAIPPQRDFYLRPMLQVTPEEIRGYLQENQIPFATDSSNSEEIYRRNFVRGQILPRLKEINSASLEHSINTISIIREENNFLQELVAEKLPLQQEENGYSCGCGDLLALPEALQGRGVARLVHALSPHFPLKQVHRTQAMDLCKSLHPSGEIFLSPLLRLQRNYGRIKCVVSQPKELENNSIKKMEIQPNETFQWGEWTITGEKIPYDPEKKGGNLLWIAPLPTLFLRSRQTGDQLTLPKRPRKSIKKWCIDEKIPEKQRKTLPVFVTEEDLVVAVATLGTDTQFLPQPQEMAWFLCLQRKKQQIDPNYMLQKREDIPYGTI